MSLSQGQSQTKGAPRERTNTWRTLGAHAPLARTPSDSLLAQAALRAAAPFKIHVGRVQGDRVVGRAWGGGNKLGEFGLAERHWCHCRCVMRRSRMLWSWWIRLPMLAQTRAM